MFPKIANHIKKIPSEHMPVCLMCVTATHSEDVSNHQLHQIAGSASVQMWQGTGVTAGCC